METSSTIESESAFWTKINNVIQEVESIYAINKTLVNEYTELRKRLYKELPRSGYAEIIDSILRNIQLRTCNILKAIKLLSQLSIDLTKYTGNENLMYIGYIHYISELLTGLEKEREINSRSIDTLSQIISPEKEIAI